GPESGVKLPIETDGGGSGSFSSSLHETMNVERIAIGKIMDSFRAFDIRIQFVLMMPQLGTKMNLANRRNQAWLWCVRFGCGLCFSYRTYAIDLLIHVAHRGMNVFGVWGYGLRWTFWGISSSRPRYVCHRAPPDADVWHPFRARGWW